MNIIRSDALRQAMELAKKNYSYSQRLDDYVKRDVTEWRKK